ncbi:hypothetical protein [Pleurocapsa sp. PCC 7319]|uniref:hypothetical protein n=1 Tax=Pleurocapsa sp. PCC 7319 TaxID=118161 RepID=UPI0003799709|nr:hypothetical protein [Pleurocapsa sp. PCC 7319]
MSNNDFEEEYEKVIINKLIELSETTKLLKKDIINIKKDMYKFEEDLQDIQPMIESVYNVVGSLKLSLTIINILMIISILSIVFLTVISNQ